MNKFIQPAFVALMIASLVSAPGAQTAGFSAADTRELASYRLTMETAKKIYALMLGAAQEMANDPKAQALQKTKAQIEALSKKEELTDAESDRLEKLHMQAEQQEDALDDGSDGLNLNDAKDLNEMEARIKANPRFHAALTKGGLTAREFSKYVLASLMAGMVAGLQKSGAIKELPSELRAVNPENVKFVLDHQKELAAMQEEMEKLDR